MQKNPNEIVSVRDKMRRIFLTLNADQSVFSSTCYTCFKKTSTNKVDCLTSFSSECLLNVEILCFRRRISQTHTLTQQLQEILPTERTNLLFPLPNCSIIKCLSRLSSAFFFSLWPYVQPKIRHKISKSVFKVSWKRRKIPPCWLN